MTTRAARHMAAMTRAGMTEAVIYRPGEGRARRIEALVDREGIQVQGQSGRPALSFTAINDPLAGIAANTLDAGADAIDVAERVGGQARTRQIKRLAAQDAEWITVEVA